jgi:hypothetical protein
MSVTVKRRFSFDATAVATGQQQYGLSTASTDDNDNKVAEEEEPYIGTNGWWNRQVAPSLPAPHRGRISVSTTRSMGQKRN